VSGSCKMSLSPGDHWEIRSPHGRIVNSPSLIDQLGEIRQVWVCERVERGKRGRERRRRGSYCHSSVLQ
jgi:hypothetical protein